MNHPGGVHTADNQIPPLDDELAGLFDDLACVRDVGIDQILSGLRHIALARHSIDHSQTLTATLAGGVDGTNIVTAIGHIIARLADAESNPALRTLPLEQQKTARLAGEHAFRALADPDLHQTASETCAAIDGV
jgi:hypothetical protein